MGLAKVLKRCSLASISCWGSRGSQTLIPSGCVTRTIPHGKASMRSTTDTRRSAGGPDVLLIVVHIWASVAPSKLVDHEILWLYTSISRIRVGRTVLTSRLGIPSIGGGKISLFVITHLVDAISSKVKAIEGFNRVKPTSSPDHFKDCPETVHYRLDLMPNDLSCDELPTVYKHLCSVVGR